MSTTVQGWIYKITNTVNGKVYVGQTSGKLKYRLNAHKSQLINHKHHNSHLQAAWNKYGESAFVFEVIEEFNPEMNFDLDNLERYWIKHYDSMNPEKGYNKQDGGGVNRLISDETRIKMSLAGKGRKQSNDWVQKRVEASAKWRTANPDYNVGENNYWFGKTLSKEIREKMKKPKSEETKLKMRDAWDNGRKQKHALKQLGNKNHMFGKPSKNRKKVICIETNIIYDSIIMAAQEIGSPRECVRDVCLGRQKTTKGLTFKYLENKEVA